MRQPHTINALWGIWIADGGPNDAGDWMQHDGYGGDGPEVYESREAAEAAVRAYSKGHFRNRIAVAPLTDAAAEQDRREGR